MIKHSGESFFSPSLEQLARKQESIVNRHFGGAPSEQLKEPYSRLVRDGQDYQYRPTNSSAPESALGAIVQERSLDAHSPPRCPSQLARLADTRRTLNAAWTRHSDSRRLELDEAAAGRQAVCRLGGTAPS